MDDRKDSVEIKYEVSWQAPEFLYYEKTIFWYVGVVFSGVVVLLLALFLLKNILFSIFVIASVVLLIVYGSRRPPILNIGIDQNGMHLDKYKSYSFDRLGGFAVYVLHPELTKDYFQLILCGKAKLSTHVKILVPIGDLDKIRRSMLRYLPELEYTESLIDHIGHILRF